MTGTWWGPAAGFLAGASMIFACTKITVSLSSLKTREFLESLVGDGKSEAAAEGILWAVTLYRAAAYPVTPGGVSLHERKARRTIAYQLAAYDSLPNSVRVVAAQALAAVHQGEDADRAQAAVWTLHKAVRACRPGYIHKPDSDQNS